MKKIIKLLIIVISVVVLTGCLPTTLTSVKSAEFNDNTIAVLVDIPTRATALNAIEKKLIERKVTYRKINSTNEAMPTENILSYSMKWSWDLAIYLRKVDMRITTPEGGVRSSLVFDAVGLGGFGKFGNGEKRIGILVDLLIGELTEEEALFLLEKKEEKNHFLDN